jgi:hypothetical protein
MVSGKHKVAVQKNQKNGHFAASVARTNTLCWLSLSPGTAGACFEKLGLLITIRLSFDFGVLRGPALPQGTLGCLG